MGSGYLVSHCPAPHDYKERHGRGQACSWSSPYQSTNLDTSAAHTPQKEEKSENESSSHPQVSTRHPTTPTPQANPEVVARRQEEDPAPPEESDNSDAERMEDFGVY